MTASTAQSRNATHRNGLGLSALGLGVAGVLVGVFAGGVWFVIVPVGLLAMILGVFGVSQRRYYAAVDVTAAVLGVLAGAVALALGIWGTGAFLASLHQSADRVIRIHPAPAVTGGTIGWGQPRDFGNDVIVTISAPVAFGPAGGTTRSVVLNVTITNSGTVPYRPDGSVYAPSATFDGHALHPIPLPDGTVDRPKTNPIPPGGLVGYRVAYALPTKAGELLLTLRPNPNAPDAVIGGAV